MSEPLRLMLWHWGRRGGGPRYTMELARVLAGRPGLELHLSLSRQSELFADTDSFGLPSFHVDTYSGWPGFLTRTPLLPLMSRQLLDYISSRRIDVVFNTMDFLWGSAIAPVIGRAGALYLLAVHDAQRHPGEDGPLRRWLLARDIGLADGAVTLTAAVGEQLVKLHDFPRERVWTAPLGVFLGNGSGAARDLPRGRPIRLLFFGRILPYKGLDTILAALPLIRAARPDIELEIWGSGDIAPYRAVLEQTQGVRLEHRWLEEQDIPAIFERTDICVLPYREASQSAVTASALAVGMPVITTPLPSLVEQIGAGRAGVVAADFSPAAFARAVIDLVAKPAEYRRLSEEAVAFSRSTLSWETIGDRVEQAVRALDALGPRRRS
jgi:glycosyltransferase involved in cell wall biosynthesis